MMTNNIALLQNILQKSKSIIFFGGAGVSTESGIPDFRSNDGLYKQKYKIPPEIILSHDSFFNHIQEFYKYYYDKIVNLSLNQMMFINN